MILDWSNRPTLVTLGAKVLRVTKLVVKPSNEIFLIAPDLLGESLANQLTRADPDLKVLLEQDELKRNPCLVIWSIESLDVPSVIHIELRRLQEHWKPSPLLLLLPAKTRLSTAEILQFDCPGLLQDPDLKTLIEAIKTLRGGGRVVRLKDEQIRDKTYNQTPIGLGQWLLASGVQQINNDLKTIDDLLNPPPKNSFHLLVLHGRRRELRMAKSLIFWLWGAKVESIKTISPNNQNNQSKGNHLSNGADLRVNQGLETNISLNKRHSMAVWSAIHTRLKKAVQGGLINSTGSLLAIEGLNPNRQTDLLIALLYQLDQVVNKLRDSEDTENSYLENWIVLQPELRQQALRNMSGNYVRLPLQGELKPVTEELLFMSNLREGDDELPKADQMLEPLLLDKPVLVEGQLLPADDPRALMHLEMFFGNWLLRNAEIVSAEVIEVCGVWPELRRYLLEPHLISTRELERLRNQLNTQNRWQNFIERPIQLYESKRLLYTLKNGHIEPVLITEPRDEELRQLGWWQQQVALLVEARDALAPQLQALVKRIGDLMVVILTQMIGRAIGLIGKGIAQGMGRSLGRS